ncbi:diamine acetyltransferase 1-like isoform X2 [Hemicordylus capensis]|uniref:diamine acetyltransferase 1-like isoform X2 n=1 Tax=Hemicordylus capensis TaxID=884348 RepID=UPI0023040035|nr:diamine acetyltransferase 1-like isoform X2 [Hemicordylus capensis]
MSFLIRQCAPKDMKDLMRFVREIAGLYCVPVDTIRIKEEDLKEAGFGKHPRYECFVAEVPPEQKTKEGHTLIGYILSVYTYSIWRGKNLYIDNLYVMPEFRGYLSQWPSSRPWQQMKPVQKALCNAPINTQIPSISWKLDEKFLPLASAGSAAN